MIIITIIITTIITITITTSITIIIITMVGQRLLEYARDPPSMGFVVLRHRVVCMQRGLGTASRSSSFHTALSQKHSTNLLVQGHGGTCEAKVGKGNLRRYCVGWSWGFGWPSSLHSVVASIPAQGKLMILNDSKYTYNMNHGNDINPSNSSIHDVHVHVIVIHLFTPRLPCTRSRELHIYIIYSYISLSLSIYIYIYTYVYIRAASGAPATWTAGWSKPGSSRIPWWVFIPRYV